MYIIIAGGGLIGRGLGKKLAENKHDVVIIDKDIETCESIYEEIGAVTINGGLVVTGTMTGQSNISTTGTISTTSTMSCSDISVNGKNVDGHIHAAGTPPGNTGAF